MLRFFVAVGLVGCGASAVAGREAVVEPAVPCPVVPAASVPAAVVPPSKAEPSAETTRSKREQVRVEAFDCFSTLEEKRTDSLRGWASGGPDGAAWNVEGAPLRCELKLNAPCAGTVALRVLGNTKPIAKREAVLAADENTLEMRLPSAAWEKALEASAGPYSVLLISISGLLTCSTDSGDERFHFADAFVAGFSGGE